MSDDLGRDYAERMFAPVELSPEDEDAVQRLLGRSPYPVKLTAAQVTMLEKVAKERGITLQQLLNVIGETAITQALVGHDVVQRPDDGQHR